MSQDESKPSDIPELQPEERPLAGAWQPLTPRGVAAFSLAPVGRLLLIQFIIALLAAGAVVWFLATAWFPILREGIRQLPESGVIQDQQLSYPRPSTDPLAENRFLALVVDLDGAGVASLATDLRVEFHRRQVVLCAFPGCLGWNYPKGWVVQFNQPELESWWGAWETAIHLLIGLAVVAGLFANWLVLATLYCPVARIYAFFKDRQLTLLGSWKLSAAALLPGTLLSAAALVLYEQGVIDLLRCLVLWALQLPVGWVYLFTSPLRLPRASDALHAPGRNPFGREKPGLSNPFDSSEQRATRNRVPGDQ